MMPEAQGIDCAIDMSSADAQQRLQRLYRYAQIGRCVNSVTHDVNNFLGAILAYAELIELDSDLTKESSRMVQEVIGAVRKSSTLINNLTDVARKEKPDVRLVDPTQLLNRVLDLRRYDIKLAQIGLKTESSADLTAVLMDLPKVEQALIYLLNNAIEALDTVERRQIRIDVTFSDGYADFSFWNSGETIPEELREMIFEPFFTTKAGEHVGLGLTIARETARLHDGDVFYTPERGFTFRIPKRNRLEESRRVVA